MHEQFGYHAREEEPKQTPRESETGPILPVLQDVQGIALEVYRLIKVHLLKCPHWDLSFATVLHPIRFGPEVEIVLDRKTRKSSLFILARRQR